MKDKYINDIEPMILNWLKSGNENTTMIAYEISEYVREQVKLCSIPHVVGRSELFKCPTCCDTKVKDNGDYCADCEEPPDGI
jgi:hypothetical protein